MAINLQARASMTTTPREQAAARALIAKALRHDGFCDFNWITPRLATGGRVETDADVAAVATAGIDTLIDCRSEFAPHAAAFQERLARTHPHLTYHHCPTADDGHEKDAAWFTPGIEAALAALKRPDSRVLAYCEMGLNRGPSTAYAIMRALGVAGDEAAGLLIDRRPVVQLAYRADADAAISHLGYHPDEDAATTYLGYGLLRPTTFTRPMSTVITHGWRFAITMLAAPVGLTEHWDGPLVANMRGLHGSERALDALVYMPLAAARQDIHVRWCAFGGQVATGDREWAASERTVVWSADATLALRAFAAWCYEDLKRQAWDMTASQAARQVAICRIWQTEAWAEHENPVYAAVGAALHALGGPASFWAGDRATVMARRRYSLHLESLLEKLSPGHEHEAEELRAAKEAEDARKAEDVREFKEGMGLFLGVAFGQQIARLNT